MWATVVITGHHKSNCMYTFGIDYKVLLNEKNKNKNTSNIYLHICIYKRIKHNKNPDIFFLSLALKLVKYLKRVLLRPVFAFSGPILTTASRIIIKSEQDRTLVTLLASIIQTANFYYSTIVNYC